MGDRRIRFSYGAYAESGELLDLSQPSKVRKLVGYVDEIAVRSDSPMLPRRDGETEVLAEVLMTLPAPLPFTPSVSVEVPEGISFRDYFTTLCSVFPEGEKKELVLVFRSPIEEALYDLTETFLESVFQRFSHILLDGGDKQLTLALPDKKSTNSVVTITRFKIKVGESIITATDSVKISECDIYGKPEPLSESNPTFPYLHLEARQVSLTSLEYHDLVYTSVLTPEQESQKLFETTSISLNNIWLLFATTARNTRAGIFNLEQAFVCSINELNVGDEIEALTIVRVTACTTVKINEYNYEASYSRTGMDFLFTNIYELQALDTHVSQRHTKADLTDFVASSNLAEPVLFAFATNPASLRISILNATCHSYSLIRHFGGTIGQLKIMDTTVDADKVFQLGSKVTELSIIGSTFTGDECAIESNSSYIAKTSIRTSVIALTYLSSLYADAALLEGTRSLELHPGRKSVGRLNQVALTSNLVSLIPVARQQITKDFKVSEFVDGETVTVIKSAQVDDPADNSEATFDCNGTLVDATLGFIVKELASFQINSTRINTSTLDIWKAKVSGADIYVETVQKPVLYFREVENNITSLYLVASNTPPEFKFDACIGSIKCIGSNSKQWNVHVNLIGSELIFDIRRPAPIMDFSDALLLRSTDSLGSIVTADLTYIISPNLNSKDPFTVSEKRKKDAVSYFTK